MREGAGGLGAESTELANPGSARPQSWGHAQGNVLENGIFGEMDVIPYKSLVRMALVTVPLIGVALVLPIFIASGVPLYYLWFMLPGVTGMVGMAWAFNLLLLRWGRLWRGWPWMQVLVGSAFMVAVSSLAFLVVDSLLPPEVARLHWIRFVNIIAVNALIYILIRLRLLSLQKEHLANENTRLELTNLEAQYKLLKDQVNPHFLFNALGTAKSLVRRSPESAEAYIIRLSDFLRAGLRDAPDSVPLREELKLVRDYVALQQMRFHEALVYVCEIDGSGEVGRLPFFSLLTLVENAVKHNTMRVEAPLHVEVVREGMWVWVRNNLQGKAVGEASMGSGLDNLRERCRLLGHGEVAVVRTETHFSVGLQLLPS